MYACRVTRDRDQLHLRPTFGTLTGFWLLLAIPVSSLLVGTLIWWNVDARRAIVPSFAYPLFLTLAGFAVVCLVVSAGTTPFPLILDREKGLRRGRNWLPTAEMTSIRVEGDSDDFDQHYHLWVHLRNGDRVELKRSLWLLESDHDRACAIGHELAEFLDVPFIDCSFRPTRVPVHTFSLTQAAVSGAALARR